MKLFQPIFGARGEDVKLRGLKKSLKKPTPTTSQPVRSSIAVQVHCITTARRRPGPGAWKMVKLLLGCEKFMTSDMTYMDVS